ncbi:MAG: hypothetical protein A2Z81_05595 [Omnitrophica WOR_2 bacterium GWA2_45_18]|nr:MAG: hypothetical protein A2Z81_05595 [Omnitrophica WOR_2 bacterium GWA2_45_18]
MSKSKPSAYKKIVVGLGGIFILIAGLTLILLFWKDVVIIFKGTIGMILALAGLLMLYALNQ